MSVRSNPHAPLVVDVLRESVRQKGAELNTITGAILKRGADATPTASEQRKITALTSDLQTISMHLADAEASVKAGDVSRRALDALDQTIRAGGGTPLDFPGGSTSGGVYRRGSGESFFLDLARSVTSNDRTVHQRLADHQEEQRANSRVTGAGGEFVPPLWLIDQFAPLARPARAFADVMTNLDLPVGTDSINVPKIATGSLVGWQSADNAAVASQDLTTTSVPAPVLTLAGQVDISQQLLDQSPIAFDEAIFGDLTADLNRQLDVSLIGGAGTSGTPTGVYNTAGVNSVTFTSASPTLALLYSKLAGAIQTVETTRFLPPEVIVMHPRRWAWILTQADTQGRPMVVPDAGNPQNAAGVLTDVAAQAKVGTLLGLPVVVDPSIPTTSTGSALTGGTQDVIFVGRFSDAYLYEGPLMARAIPSVNSGTLGVRLQVYKYVAFTAARYPQSFAVIGGTGLSAPSF
jgi:HK97 family phage major capsid protein